MLLITFLEESLRRIRADLDGWRDLKALHDELAGREAHPVPFWVVANRCGFAVAGNQVRAIVGNSPGFAKMNRFPEKAQAQVFLENHPELAPAGMRVFFESEFLSFRVGSLQTQVQDLEDTLAAMRLKDRELMEVTRGD